MWSNKIDKFEIQLDNPDHTFSPGEIIAGRVYVELNGPKSIRSFKVRFKGKANVHWKRTTGSGKNRRTTHYRGEEEYFRTDLCLLAQADGENVEIQTGSHIFPFEFCLPRDIPSSFESTHGNIRYTMKAIMDRPWKFDHETSIAFTVETPHELNQCTATTISIDNDEYKSFCCFPCINMGQLKFNIFLPTNGFTIGEAIQAKINIFNASSSINVTKVKLRLEQDITLHSQHPRRTKTETNVVQKVKEERNFSKMDEVVLCIQVPSLPYSDMVYCSIIDIEYYLNVIISVSGCHCSMKRRYPIVIGSGSVLNVETAGNSATIPIPTAPFFPVESPMPVSYPPPHGDEFSGKTGNVSDTGFSNHLPNYNFTPGSEFYPSASTVHMGFVNPNSAQTNSLDGSTETMPPSYNEAMGINEKH